MPFGRHRGQTIDEIPRSYLRWVLENCHSISPHLRAAIADQLGERPQWTPPPPPPPPRTPPASALDNLVRQWLRQMTLKYHPDRGGHHEAMIAVVDGAELLRSLAKQITAGGVA